MTPKAFHTVRRVVMYVGLQLLVIAVCIACAVVPKTVSIDHGTGSGGTSGTGTGGNKPGVINATAHWSAGGATTGPCTRPETKWTARSATAPAQEPPNVPGGDDMVHCDQYTPIEGQPRTMCTCNSTYSFIPVAPGSWKVTAAAGEGSFSCDVVVKPGGTTVVNLWFEGSCPSVP